MNARDRRLEGWEERLNDALARHSTLPFSWPNSNCLHLAMDCARALTGEDPYDGTRGKYQNEAGAAKVMRKLGFRSVTEMMQGAFEPVPPARARRGDIGIVVQENGEPVCVVVLGSQVIGKFQTGVHRLPRDRMVSAFKVGWK